MKDEKKEKPEIERAPGETQPTPSPPKELIIDIYTPDSEKAKPNGKGDNI